MPHQKSSSHPAKAGIWRPFNVGSTAEKQRTFLASKAASDIVALIDKYDRVSSNIEVLWRTNFPYPFTTQEFHINMSTVRCDIYRLVILYMCTVPKIKGGKPHCPDRCAKKVKVEKKVTRRVKKDPPTTA